MDDNVYVTSSPSAKPAVKKTSSSYQQQPTIIRPSQGYVTVRKGDTVYGLAKKNNVPLREFISVNKLRAPYKLAIGQKLRLPSTNFHQVAKGDTVYSIARKYNVDMSSLVRTNGIKAPYTISIGQRLQLPATIVEEPKAAAGKTTTTAKAPAKTATSATTKTATTKPTTYKSPNRSGFYFARPLNGKIILPYGTAGKGIHNDGINIEGKPGQSVLAAENGVIAYIGNELAGYGNLILVKHAEGWMTAYAHNDSVTVKKGQNVKKGQPIAKVGKSGNVSTHQLHFEIRRGSKPVDPLMYLEK